MSRLYTQDHEWIDVAAKESGAEATVGITDYAQGQLGDVVFVDLPDAGRAVTKGGEAIFQARVPGAAGQPHVIVSGGHFLQEDCPEALTELLDALIRRAHA